jgi:hypothetical protein
MFLSTKGMNRDYGWNLVLWASMTFQYVSQSGVMIVFMARYSPTHVVE